MKNIPETNTPWLYTHDKSIGTEYIKIRQGNSASQKVLREGLIVDLNEEGEVVGVEILSQEMGKSSDCEKYCEEAEEKGYRRGIVENHIALDKKMAADLRNTSGRSVE